MKSKLIELIDSNYHFFGYEKSVYDYEKFDSEIKKGILKYEFLKEDIIIAAAEQNNPGISKEEITAFFASKNL